MNKPIKEWGKGIPEYSQDDILSGLELHAFCTNVVAQSMQDNEGYTIEGVILEHKPTQIIANKDGHRYFVIVAGGVFPNEGRISFALKKKFAGFCREQGVIPLFASVGLMSQDLERAAAGLALKYDEYRIKYTGAETLSESEEPDPASDYYRAYCVEQIIEAYETGNFVALYDYFAKDIQMHSQWVIEPLVGKNALIKYFDGKGRTLRKSHTTISGSVVMINQDQKRTGNIMLMSEPGKLCALVRQESDEKTNWIIISPIFNEENQLCKLALNDPQLFSFVPYYDFE